MCSAWADNGECAKNPAWMATGCPVSCEGKLPGVGENGVANEVHQLMVQKAEHEQEQKSKPVTLGDLGKEDAPTSKHTRLVRSEYADSSGFPEGADPSTCVKVSQVSTDWCRNNCASKPPVCPANLCSCSVRDAGADERKKLKEEQACGPEVGIRCGQTYFDGATRSTLKYASDVDSGAHKAATGTLGAVQETPEPAHAPTCDRRCRRWLN